MKHETEVRECRPWCFLVGATVTAHQFFRILHQSYDKHPNTYRKYDS